MKKLLFIFLLLTAPVFAAFTERYVSVAGAGAHDGTSEANAWTFAEMITAAPAAGIRVNIKAGSYSSGAVTLLGGTVVVPVVYRGYNSTIGDLDANGRNADTTLNTTNFPVFTLSGALAPPAEGMVLQNLNITGALSSGLVSGATTDRNRIISCQIVNTQNNAAARCVTMDDQNQLINSDFICTGAAHASVVALDVQGTVIGCRFQGVDTDTLLGISNGLVDTSVFLGNSANNGITFAAAGSFQNAVFSSTFYNLSTAVVLPNSVMTVAPVFKDNIVTDCLKWIESLYIGTASMWISETNTRIRDVATPRTGLDSVLTNEITTDTGGPETDYVNAGAGNLRLISTSAGTSAGMINYSDIGAFQRQPASGSQKSATY